MKLTNFALMFIGIFLPVVIIIYVNTSFVIKAEKQEMYYKNLMNSAVKDAVSQMKQVENEDTNIDYGYSGIIEKKVSINENIGFKTFFDSLASNFNIRDNEMSMERLKMYIPVVAILDYDGIYIHSAEEDENKDTVYITKPKVYYTYTYVIQKSGNILNQEYRIMDVNKISNLDTIKNTLLSEYIYEINFTMDDYVYLNIYEINANNRMSKVVVSKGFYLTDSSNNQDLIYKANILSQDKVTLRQEIVKTLDDLRKDVIAKVCMKEISYAVNEHNKFAKQSGITYNFSFSVESDSQWYETVDGIGMIAIIQGISLGNRYLNYKSYSASDLILSKRYYVSDAIYTQDNLGNIESYSYLSRKLYHVSDDCDVYKTYLSNADKQLVPRFYSSRLDAATQGYYPCPVCNP